MKKCFIGLALLLVAMPAWAQEEVALPEMTVTATRLEQDVARIPQQITVVDRQQIESMHPNSVVDVLRHVPGLVVRDYSGVGLTASVDMRGFGERAGRNVVIMLDGRRLNSIDMQDVDFSTIAVDSVERIEVMHGASAVLYGDGAVGGAINIISREGHGAPAATVEARGGSYESGEARATVQGSEDNFFWFGQGHYGGTQGYRANSEARTRGLGLNLRADPNDTTSFMLEASYDEAHYSLPGALSESQMAIDRQGSSNLYDWASRQAFNLRGQARKDLQGYGIVTTDIYYRYLQAGSEMVSYWGSPQYATTYHNIGVQPKYIVDGSLGGLRLRTTTGIDYNFWKVSSDSLPVGSGASQNEYFANMIAGYLMEEVSLTQNLIFSFGGRLHYASYDIDQKPFAAPGDNESANETQYAWTAGLTYNFAPASKVYASAGRAFRYPVVDEYVTYGMFNPDLKAEYGMDYELGGQYTFVCGLMASLNFYWMNLSNEIDYNYLTNLNENLDDTAHRGFDLNLHLPLGESNQHLLFASLSYQDVYFDGGQYDNNKLPLVPEWSGSIGGRLTLMQDLRLNARLNFIGQRYFGGDNGNSFDKMSAYATMDLGADYTWKNFTFFVNVQNLFNKYYSEYGYNYGYGASYYPSPGTLFWAGVAVKF